MRRAGLLVNGIACHRAPPVAVSVMSEPGRGRGRSPQTMSDLRKTVTRQSRAISAVVFPSISRKRRLGGSAASLPVRGFM
jgi:hypothetical protein